MAIKQTRSYTIKAGDTLSAIAAKHQLTLARLLAANPRYKADPDKIRVGTRLTIPAADKVEPPLPPQQTGKSAFVVPKGQLTFDAEGTEERGKYFSRVPHVPGPWSGVTIGRGYDLRWRSREQVVEDLVAAGVLERRAEIFAACRGFTGAKARRFLKELGLGELTITPGEQKQLFIKAYEELEGDVVRICEKADVVERYGITEWDTLPQVMRDIVVDLRYRGDYTPVTRERVQPLLSTGDFKGLQSLMADRRYWVGEHAVPTDRFRRRKSYIA